MTGFRLGFVSIDSLLIRSISSFLLYFVRDRVQIDVT